ncbi:hypothetical protein [Actinoplanes sp. L3-i22]|uniref:hypothetical protein n=1 Tax=Actinoplanes sp. L3-i22 TaxID=2836373 RepID=UPI001C78DFCE|nr:hypothetical protein [Actinoplanes sp. L3-i22]BCY12316.1 hypothetical protein L3i22_074040 [Actinoplanes sp. L3-i22]
MLIYLEPGAGWVHATDRASLERRLSGSGRAEILKAWCMDDTAGAEELLIVNQLGTHRWTKEQMNALLRISGNCA